MTLAGKVSISPPGAACGQGDESTAPQLPDGFEAPTRSSAENPGTEKFPSVFPIISFLKFILA
jgi:hypothetical protein